MNMNFFFEFKSGVMINVNTFLELVKQSPEFYSRRRNRALSKSENEEIILQQIATEMGLSLDQAKWLWEKLKDSYMSYLRGETKVFVFASKMKFLQSYLISDTDSESEDTELVESDILDALNDTNDVVLHYEVVPNSSGYFSSKESSTSGVNNQFPEEILDGDDVEVLDECCAKKQRMSKEPDGSPAVTPTSSVTNVNVSRATSHGESSGNKTPIISTSLNFSPLELLFLSYAKTLEAMPAELQYETKYKIVDIMKQADLKLLQTQMKHNRTN